MIDASTRTRSTTRAMRARADATRAVDPTMKSAGVIMAAIVATALNGVVPGFIVQRSSALIRLSTTIEERRTRSSNRSTIALSDASTDSNPQAAVWEERTFLLVQR